MKTNDELPVPVSMDYQNNLISRRSKQRVNSFKQTVTHEKRRMEQICSHPDIDFEFVLDSSGSIGANNWETTTDLIANHWIKETMRPFGSPQCGNHVAIRSYSSTHFYDLDFSPKNTWISNGFTSYTEVGLKSKVIH